MNEIAPKPGIKGIVKKLSDVRETSLLMIIILCAVILTFTNEFFFTTANLQTVLGSISINGILTIGMIVVMITGGLDLSVGSVMCMSMAFAAQAILSGVPPLLACLIGIAASALSGLLIGLVVTKLKLSHFIVTLCFMGIYRGVVYVMTAGKSISLVSTLKDMPKLAFLGSGYIGSYIPFTFVIFALLAVAADLYARRSTRMRKLYYTGSNELAAGHSGINTDRVKIGACVACSTLAGVAGIIYMSKYSGVSTSAGTGLEMTALSAAVIGGVSMNGGKGTVAGGLLGLLFIVLIQDAMNLFSVQAFWQDLIRYVIVLLAVILDVVQETARKKKNS
ncbi:monosaccharide ABC transporter membrane protein, CUT2 family [Oscillibacter sp. PC13]|uniref:ABC transporter permease n=1 Tax=Oscillibacter sp. PC13 TaxID=1855299 RepID=UPI0008E959D9|nr:ABC transporter permease [Oscillibacter sp. PC13]SFP65500.1 monosaccharide ABC transporter membrane protein, CUT2 family [Oscillibacter sp. PC13]